MLGLSQTHLSQEILLLGFLYVNDSFPWTGPSSSRAQARSHAEPACSGPELPASLPPSLPRQPAAARSWMLQQDTMSLEKSIIPSLLLC